MTKPVVGITMGDPCGVGPEIVARAIADSETSRIARTLVIGDARRLEAGARVSGVTLRVNQVTSIDDAIDKTG
ncbi:MAG: 4-hydroxythreonine-4-phosphate dehydrogenase PdxA, partial [Propionibacteriaceae bacterium]|nr:4-hydroxythreonine-4-phosphate dehydrogenase PdxA [Propionibacteriaceae bacterium]